MIRHARRGALLAAVLFAPIGALGMTIQSPVEPVGTQIAAALAGLAGLAGVALLGAGLAPAALGSRVDALVVGVALAIGVPVAALTSVLIGTFMAASLLHGFDDGARLASQVLRAGVGGALGLAPLIALAAATWIVIVRRTGPSPT